MAADRDYWTELIALDYENPSAGILETSWVEIGLDQKNRHKYQIKLSRATLRVFRNIRHPFTGSS